MIVRYKSRHFIFKCTEQMIYLIEIYAIQHNTFKVKTTINKIEFLALRMLVVFL